MINKKIVFGDNSKALPLKGIGRPTLLGKMRFFPTKESGSRLFVGTVVRPFLKRYRKVYPRGIRKVFYTFLYHKKGFTLVELLIVVIIIGILAGLAIANYGKTKENVLDKEATSNLKLIRVAESSYRMDIGTYYPAVASDSNIANINANLKVSLPSGSNRNWDYTVWSTGCSRATRNGGDGRSWYLTIDDADGEPDAGAGCL